MKKLSALLLVTPALAFAHNVADNIQILPLNKIAFPKELQQEMQSYNANGKAHGYVQKDNEYPRQLLKMRYKTLKFAKSDDLAEKELKKSSSEIPLTFSYKSKVSNPIAYAGIGIVSDKGFSGIKEFFDGKEIGMCTLSVFNREGVSQPIQLNEDGLRYDVNDKPTRVSIEGSENSGFMYSVRWYDKNFMRDLECANNKFDHSITSKMIELANKIDKK